MESTIDAEQLTSSVPDKSTGEEVDSECVTGKGKVKWNHGRRIVELGTLAKNLFCHDCSLPLKLENTEGKC